ncbi:hypothetical protein [Shinella sp.]|uniref:hypothetical protein n=1 Tax=Shinella sp. TaxID=1870904 RepID=UPI0029B66B16|nr:hypothetical protein [Shinella sp.]MDX3973255.1 hypothetical protein [Shinella sp.]
MVNIEKIATELARLMKGANDDDAGNFAHYFDDAVYDDEGKGPIWNAICDRAEELLPTIVITGEEWAAWARADRELSACERYEQQQLGLTA